MFVHGGLGDLHTFQRQVQEFATTASVANGPRQGPNGHRVCSPAVAERDRRRHGLIGDSSRLSILVFPVHTQSTRDTSDQKSSVSSLHGPRTSTSTKADARCSTARSAAAFGSKLGRRQLQEPLSSVIANALQEASYPHQANQAGSTFNTDSAADVAALVTSLRWAISSTIDVTSAASVKLLSLPSRLEREPSKPARKSATPS